MLIENEFTVAAPIEGVWATLLDVERVAPCMPGAELTETVDERNWKGKVTIKVRDNGIGVDPQHAARSRPAMKLRTNVFSFISTPTTPSSRSAATR